MSFGIRIGRGESSLSGPNSYYALSIRIRSRLFSSLWMQMGIFFGSGNYHQTIYKMFVKFFLVNFRSILTFFNICYDHTLIRTRFNISRIKGYFFQIVFFKKAGSGSALISAEPDLTCQVITDPYPAKSF